MLGSKRKYLTKCRVTIPLKQFFVSSARNNAKIAGRYFDQKLGVLEEGAAADVIIVNYNPLTPMNENNINGHLVFGVTGHDVVTTVANGKVLMKDRRLTEIDEAKVMADCRQAAAELGKRINSR